MILDDNYKLAATLDAYELQELSAHDLSRYLPVGVADDETPEPIMPPPQRHEYLAI